MVHATGDRALGLETAQLIALAHWIQSISGHKPIRLEIDGIRMQTVGTLAAALEPGLFSTVVIRHGMPSFSHLLEKPVAYSDAPDFVLSRSPQILRSGPDFDLGAAIKSRQPLNESSAQNYGDVLPVRLLLPAIWR